MNWIARAQEGFHQFPPSEFVVDGTQFVIRRAVSRALVATLRSVDETATRELRFGSSSSSVIEEGGGRLPKSYLDRTGTYESPQSAVKEFTDARLVGPYALGLTEPGNVITETAGGSIYLLWPTVSGMIKQEGSLATTQWLHTRKQPTEKYDYAASLVSFNADNYYHWILEHLPQLRGIEHYAETEGVDPVLLIPPDPPRWMTESLAACGYDESNWVEWHGGSVAVDHLIVPDHPFRSGEIEFPPIPENCQWIRDRVMSNVGFPSGVDFEYSPYIYISREDADSRRVVNREALLDELRPFGFESYVLSELSFAQQVSLFAQAEVIVAPHGAGATNMVFASGATFVELCHSGNPRAAHFFVLAHECGHDYVSLLCEPVGADMSADVDETRRQVELVL